jgi:hypothetical protein
MVASHATPRADWWEGGTVPLLVVQGLDDRRAPPAIAVRSATKSAHVYVWWKGPRGGHLALREQLQAVADAVIALLLEHEPGRGQVWQEPTAWRGVQCRTIACRRRGTAYAPMSLRLLPAPEAWR